MCNEAGKKKGKDMVCPGSLCSPDSHGNKMGIDVSDGGRCGTN